MAAVTYQLRTRPVRTGVYWRRRLVALVIFAGLVLALATVAGRLRSVPHAASEPGSLSTALVARHVHVVAPGDTLWSIARAAHPQGDVRKLVQELADNRHGRPLQVGERLEVPTEGGGSQR
jgi:LysM repeat protein